jgi:hypothetical protein
MGGTDALAFSRLAGSEKMGNSLQESEEKTYGAQSERGNQP